MVGQQVLHAADSSSLHCKSAASPSSVANALHPPPLIGSSPFSADIAPGAGSLSPQEPTLFSPVVAAVSPAAAVVPPAALCGDFAAAVRAVKSGSQQVPTL